MQMKPFLKRLALLCVAVTSSLAMMTGCASPSSESPSSGAAETTAATAAPESSDATGATVTVQDVKGDVEIPAEPKRVIDLSGNSDVLHILGYSVIGTANTDAYDHTRLPSFLEDVLADAKILGFSYQDTMDIENILPLEPDLIIISTRQEKMYEQLKGIAPTVMIELAQIDWKEDLLTMARIFDKETLAQAWLDDYLAKAAAAGEKVRAQNGEDTTYFSFLASGGQLYVFDEAGFGSILYGEMGLAKPEGMPVQENVSLPVIGYEGLAAIDADYVIVVATEEDMANLRENPIWNKLRAVTEGHVVALPSSPYFNQTYSSIGRELLFDEIPGWLEKAK